MKIEQTAWTSETGWQPSPLGQLSQPAHLVTVFGARAALLKPELMAAVKSAYPTAHVLGCSTAGEICSTRVTDGSLVVTAVHFETTKICCARVTSSAVSSSHDAGERLARSLPADGLAHVFVLSEGLNINGSALVAGMMHALPPSVTLTGGLSADGGDFRETVTVWDGEPQREAIVAVGFYGAGLQVGYGSVGGWDPFGPERLITRSAGNVLYEMDGHSALELYKKYLGEHALGLPATGLLFPLCVRHEDSAQGVVRTILAVNEQEQSMTFAGDVPEGAFARLMKANFDRLIDGATGAARTALGPFGDAAPELALLISCVGRKMVLRQRVEEEVEAVREVVGPNAVMAGFYSYGEISPHMPNARCELHNQTMTVTTFRE